MATIRDLFHEIGNQYNRISVSAGVEREKLKQKSLDSLNTEELKEKNDKLVSTLDSIEQATEKATEMLQSLKKTVYELTNPDTQVLGE